MLNFTANNKHRRGRLTAADRGYEATCDSFAEGDTVRVDGIVGDRFTVLGFRNRIAELFTQEPNTGQRSIAVERLRKAKPTAEAAKRLAFS